MFHGFIPHIMGTRFDILLIHSDIDRLNTLWADIAYELERLDKILNRFDPHSEVSKINSHTSQSKIQISKEMESILQLCSYYYESTSHLFDITLKDFSRIQLHEHSYISFTSPDISLDFGGFAKGYALKKIRKFIEQENISDAFANWKQFDPGYRTSSLWRLLESQFSEPVQSVSSKRIRSAGYSIIHFRQYVTIYRTHYESAYRHI